MFWLNRIVFGNTLLRWLIAAGVAAAILALARLVRGWLRARLARRAAGGGRAAPANLLELFSHTHFWFALALALTLAGQVLEFPPRVEHYLDLALPLALIGQLAAWAHRAVGLWVERRFGDDPASHGSSASRAAVIGFLLRLGLWSLVLLLALDTLGFNVSTLLTSLGIGGIAVALAVQNILGDLFASLSIAMDQPFVIGDFIIVGDCLGTVQFVGLKTTRIRSLSGEQIVISNSELLKSRIRNYKKMVERRAVFELCLAHRTPPGQVAGLPDRLRRIIEAQPGVRFDRAHFKEFAEAGLKFEAVYYLLNPDMNVYMDTQQAINLEILAALHQDGVEFGRDLRVLDCAGLAPRAKMES